MTARDRPPLGLTNPTKGERAYGLNLSQQSSDLTEDLSRAAILDVPSESPLILIKVRALSADILRLVGHAGVFLRIPERQDAAASLIPSLSQRTLAR